MTASFRGYHRNTDAAENEGRQIWYHMHRRVDGSGHTDPVFS